MQILNSPPSKNLMIKLLDKNKPLTITEVKSRYALKKYASGNITTDSSAMITVSGLTFTPSIIVIGRIADTSPSIVYYSVIEASAYRKGTGGNIAVSLNGGYINSSGFKLTTDFYSESVSWIAIE